MKTLLVSVLVSLFCLSSVWPMGIVNNTSVSATSEDSVSFAFYNLDSVGQNIGGLDTTRVVVINSTGSTVFNEKVSGASGRVSELTVNEDTSYVYTALVADIDGSGSTGIYGVSIVAQSNATGANLSTPHRFSFQLVNWELDEMGQASLSALDSLAKVLDSVNVVMDSLHAVLDTLQSQDDWGATFSYQSTLFGNQISLSTDIAEIQSDLDVVSDTANTTLDYLRGQPSVDIGCISGDANAADNLEAILDGSGGVDLHLKTLHVVSSDQDDTAVVISANHEQGGIGLFVQGRDCGLYAQGTESFGESGVGAKFEGTGADIEGNLSGSVTTLTDSVRVHLADKEVLAGIVADSVLEDSLSYRGSSAGIDSALIARSIWNTPQGNHVIDGTFGAYLDANISGLGSGSGTYSFTIAVADSSAGQMLPGVDVAIRNVTQTALLAVGQTSTEGTVSFSLDLGTYVVIASSTGYLFEPFDTLDVTGTGNDTLYGYFFDPGTPVNPSLCRVYGFLYDLAGAPLGDAGVTASLPSGVRRTGSLLVSPFAVSTESDSSGYFFLDLIPSSLLQPEGSQYEISIKIRSGVILRERLTVPDNQTWQLTW